MVDNLTKAQRRKTMARVKSKDTGPEMIVRRLIHGLGYRYRLHRKDLPGKPDLVFPGRKKVVFVHGCFWHGHNCKAGQNKPASNQDYWLPKLDRNRARDQKNQKQLAAMGWKSLVIWECQTKDLNKLAATVKSFLGMR